MMDDIVDTINDNNNNDNDDNDNDDDDDCVNDNDEDTRADVYNIAKAIQDLFL